MTNPNPRPSGCSTWSRFRYHNRESAVISRGRPLNSNFLGVHLLTANVYRWSDIADVGTLGSQMIDFGLVTFPYQYFSEKCGVPRVN
jgi:hypothetical protein